MMTGGTDIIPYYKHKSSILPQIINIIQPNHYYYYSTPKITNQTILQITPNLALVLLISKFQIIINKTLTKINNQSLIISYYYVNFTNNMIYYY